MTCYINGKQKALETAFLGRIRAGKAAFLTHIACFGWSRCLQVKAILEMP
jgi:hypothetical protein